MDLNRIGNLIKKTKDKIIVATDTDLLVVMDLDSYEELIKENQAKTQFIAKEQLKDEVVDEKQALNDIIGSDVPISTPEVEKHEDSGPISLKDVISERAEQSFAPPINTIQKPDEQDEYFFEEIED